MSLKHIIPKIPLIGTVIGKMYVKILSDRFETSEQYWNRRYARGGNSGKGSCGQLAQFKAEVLNTFVEKQQITSIIEYGCGDGAQLKLTRYKEYIGFDISSHAIECCQKTFRADPSKCFKLMQAYDGETAELTLSLDVLYHLIEDAVFENYMLRLFKSATRFAIIYSSNTDQQEHIQVPHVKHRNFTKWIEQHIFGWSLLEYIPNKYPYARDNEQSSWSDFYIYHLIS